MHRQDQERVNRYRQAELSDCTDQEILSYLNAKRQEQARVNGYMMQTQRRIERMKQEEAVR